MSTLISIGGLKSSVILDASQYFSTIQQISQRTGQMGQQIIANNAAISASFAALEQKAAQSDVFKPLTTSVQTARRNIKTASDDSVADLARIQAQADRIANMPNRMPLPKRQQLPDAVGGGINTGQDLGPSQDSIDRTEKFSAATRALNSALDPAEQHEQRLQLLRATHAERVTQLTASLAQLQRATAAEGQTEEQRTALLRRTQQTEVELAREETALAHSRAQTTDQAASGALRGLLNATGGQLLGGLSLAGGVATLTTKLVGLGQESVDVARQAETIGTAYQAATNRAGIGADDLLAKLQTASRGTVSQNDLMQSSNKALALGVGEDAQQIADLLSIARQKGKDFGLTTADSFEQITTGLGRLSPRILDNLGILIDENQVYKEYAKSIGTTADRLSDQEKRQALVNDLIKNNTDLIRRNADAQLDANDQQAQAEARRQQAEARFGQKALPIETTASFAGAGLLDAVTGGLSGADFQAAFRQAKGNLIDLANPIQAVINYTQLLAAAEEHAANSTNLSNDSRRESILTYEASTRAVKDNTDATAANEAAQKAVKAQLDTATATLKFFQDAQLIGTKAYGDELSRLQIIQDKATLAAVHFQEVGGGLDKILAPIQQNIDAQQASVDRLSTAVDGAQAAVKRQQHAVDDATRTLATHESAVQGAQKAYDGLKSIVSDNTTELNRWRSATLQGTGAFDAQLTGLNTVANSLQLRLTNLKISGAPETSLKTLEAQLARVQLQSERTKLTEGLALDPLKRQIQAFGQEGEHSFQEIIDGMKAAQGNIDVAKAKLGPAEQALKDQTVARDAAKASVDREQASLAILNSTLQDTKDRYDEENSKLGDLKKLLDTTRTTSVQPYTNAVKIASDAVQEFQLAHQVNFGKMEHDLQTFKDAKTELSYDDILKGLKVWGDAVDALSGQYKSLMNQINLTDAAGKVVPSMPGQTAPFSGGKVMPIMPGLIPNGTANGQAINAILQNTGLAGFGDAIAEFAKRYQVPVELFLSMMRKESSFLTAGSSVANNNPGNIVYTGGAYGEDSAGGRFGHYPSIAAGVEAYFKLLNREYRKFLDAGDIPGLINRYAPRFENDTDLYIRQIQQWMAEYRAQLGAGGTHAQSQGGADIYGAQSTDFNVSFNPDVYKGVADSGAPMVQAGSSWAADAQQFYTFVSGGIETLRQISKYKGVSRDAVLLFANDIYGTVTTLQTVVKDFDRDGMGAALQWTTASSAVLASVGTGIMTLDELKRFRGVSRNAALLFSNDIYGFVTTFAVVVKDFDRDALGAALQWTAAASSLLAIVDGGIAALTAIGKYKGVTRNAVLQFGNDLYGTVTTLGVIVRDFDTAALADAVAWQEGAQQVLAIIGTGVDALTALSKYKGMPQKPVWDFAHDVKEVVWALTTIQADFDQSGVDAAAAWAGSAGAVLTTLGAGVDTLKGVAKYSRVPQSAICGLEADIKEAIFAMTTIAADMDQDGVAAAAALASSGGQVITLIGGAIDGFTKLRDYTGVAPAAVRLIGHDITGLVGLMTELAKQLDPDGVAAAATFADGAGRIIAPISSAIDTFVKLKDYAGVAPATVKLIANDIYGTVSMLEEMAKTMDSDGVTAAAAVADKESTIFAALSAGLTFFKDLTDYKSEGTKKVSVLLTDITQVAKMTGSLAYQAGAAESSALEWENHLGSYATRIKAGLDSIQGLDGLTAMATVHAKVTISQSGGVPVAPVPPGIPAPPAPPPLPPGGWGTLPPGYAAGGMNLPAGWSWVGEQGRELAYVPQGTDIYNHGDVQSLIGGDRGGDTHFSIGDIVVVQQPGQNGKALADEIIAEIHRRQRLAVKR